MYGGSLTKQRLVVLGSTGSIGRQTLDIVKTFPDKFELIGLAAGKNYDLLESQIEEFQPKSVYCIEAPPSIIKNSSSLIKARIRGLLRVRFLRLFIPNPPIPPSI